MKSRPNTDLPYADILNNSHDFEGFTTYKANITSITDNFTLHFSTTAGYFLAIVYASITLDRSPRIFPQVMKDIRFTTMPTNHIKCTKTDTIMIQWMICIIMQFMMTVQKMTSLLECQLYDIGLSDYEGVQTFGGTIISVETDSGSFTGPVDESNILYVRRSKQFMYSDNDKYYSSFTGSSNYNIADRARTDMIFFTNEQYYVIVGTSLMKCTLKENRE